MGPVEREHARLDGRQRNAAVDTSEALREPERFGRDAVDRRCCTRSRPSPSLSASSTLSVSAALEAILEDESVDDHVEVVRLLPVELDLVAEVDDGPVDARAYEPFATQPLELELELAFAAATHRREQEDPRAVPQREDPIDNLLDGLRLDSLSAVGAVRDAHAREEDAEVVGDLGDGAHGRARGLRERSLLDRNGRRETIDALDVGLRELLEELPRVRRKRLDVAALAFGVDGVERERAFARAARPRDDDEPCRAAARW